MINMWFSIANYEITIPDHVFFGYMFKDRRLFGVFLNDSMMQWDSWGKNPMDWWLVGMGLTGNHGYFPIFSMGKNSGVNFPKQTNPLRKWRCLSWCHWWRSDLLKMIFFLCFSMGNPLLGESIEGIRWSTKFGGSCYIQDSRPNCHYFYGKSPFSMGKSTFLNGYQFFA